MKFHYKVEGGGDQFPARVTVSAEFAHPHQLCVNFLCILWFLLTAQRCAHEVNCHMRMVPV